MLTKEYAKSFKREIISPLIHFIDKNLVYRSEKFVSKKSYIASKIENREITDYSGDDFIYGNIDGVNIKLSELDVMVRNGDETRLSLFGLFVEAEFPKHFKAHTLVHSRRVINPSKPTSNYKKIEMDVPAFNKDFLVYSTNEIEARYILTPLLMEKILTYTKEMSYPTSLSFVDGKIYILSYCGEILSPSLQKSLLDFGVAKSYALSLHFAISLVETLRLDLKLWSKY